MSDTTTDSTAEWKADLGRRRERAASAWNLDNAIVLLPAGGPVPIAGTDWFFPFHCHPEHRYLAGTARPGAVLAFDPAEGWTFFDKPVTEDDEVWEGAAQPTGPTTKDLVSWLAARCGRRIAVLGDSTVGDSTGGSDAGKQPTDGDALQATASDADLTRELRAKLDGLRRAKDPAEIRRMRIAAAATAAGFQSARAAIAPGATERDVQADLERAFVRAGGDRPAFDTTVAAGSHSAVLHFTPTRRPIEEGELVLVDAGASYDGYASDVTRTFCAGKRTGFARDLYEAVLAAQVAAVAKCAPGREFRNIHLECAVDLARGLVDLGILRGRPEDLVARNVHALFFPHGLGHLLGLCVHDVGGYLEGRPRSDDFGLKFLRTDLPLQSGYVVTIEPGLYFVPAILNDRARRESFGDAVDWDQVDQRIGVGGVRIEDDVLITDNGHEVLTSEIPKTVDD